MDGQREVRRAEAGRVLGHMHGTSGCSVEPPEPAGRSLYERLEISGMRSQLLRRTTDLKKNIGGASRYLEVLREMTHVVSEEKMFALNQSLELPRVAAAQQLSVQPVA